MAAQATRAGGAGASVGQPAPTGRDVDHAHLHPHLRARMGAVLTRLRTEGLPFRLFEGYRSPQRQQYLWDQGRVRPGGKVTNARAWESLHQYGLAADFVLYENGKWSWDDSGAKARWWRRLRQIGEAEGLRSLSWEAPHLELAEARLADLRAGRYPSHGDPSWADKLAQAIYAWTGVPAAPALPEQIIERPVLAQAGSAAALQPGALPAPGAQTWHASFGGCAWRFDERGVYLRTHRSGREPLRTKGEPKTMRAIWSAFSDAISTAAVRYGIAPELVMTMLANETAVYRSVGFTGPMTFRWEAGVLVNDVAPARKGDYSAGPMQVLGSTARWVMRAQRLDYDPFAVAIAYEQRPEPPAQHPMYDPGVNLDIGTAVMKQRWKVTGADPILVAAAYNAGGCYRSSANPWHLRCAGNHLDRTAQWYGDACAVLCEAGVRT